MSNDPNQPYQPNYQQPDYQQQQGYQQQPGYQNYPSPNQMNQPPVSNKTQVLGLDYNIAGGLCYLPFFMINLIVPILILATEPKSSRFVRFHAAQSLMLAGTGLVLGIVMMVLWIIGGVIAAIAGHTIGPVIIFVMALLVGLFGIVFGIGSLVMVVIAMIKAFQNTMWQMPIIGGYAKRFSE